MNEPLNLREAANQLLHDLEDPNYVPPDRPTRTVSSAPEQDAPKRVLPDDLRAMLDGLDVSDMDERVIESAREARGHVEKHFVRIDEVNRIATTASKEKANALRDEFRYKEVIATPQEAKAKLRSLAIQEKFAVPDVLSRNMQALCSYYNGKEHGKRFKTERAGGATSMLIVWRTR